ncbi:SMC family ATPase, partial [Candidatus Margulisiibacteriota bacterium]
IDLANLCLRLAISQYVTEQYGAEMYFVVLDEIFGSQDMLRKRAILEALAELNKRFRQIILITHVEEVKDIVGQAVRVFEDEAGVSHVQI